MKKILILFSGISYEHAISYKSAKTILKHIDHKKYETKTVGIDKSGAWYLFNDDINLLTNDNWLKGNIKKIDNIIEYLKYFDKIFPIIHGSPLENGNLQGLFDLFNINYVGTDSESSIISYDKDLTKTICNKFNIPQVPSITLTNYQKLKKINIPFPVIIKPAKCNSSIGINIANNLKELNKYIKSAFSYDNKVIVEKYIKARILECAILKDKKLITSPIGEIKLTNNFYDYESIDQENNNLIIPANISKELTKEIQTLSLKIFNILLLKNLSIISFLYDYNNHKLYFNKVKSMPDFTDTSMYPLLFNHLNISTKNLITKLIENE